MTHFSVVWEILFACLIWKPLWRPLVLAEPVALHVGIGLAWGCRGTFGLIMLVGCASFLPNEMSQGILSSGACGGEQGGHASGRVESRSVVVLARERFGQ